MKAMLNVRTILALGLLAAVAASPAPAVVISTPGDQSYVSGDVSTTIDTFASYSGDDVYIAFDVDWSSGAVGDNDFFVLWFNHQNNQNIGIKGNRGNGSGPEDYLVRNYNGDSGAYSPTLATVPTEDLRLIGRLSKTASGAGQPYNEFSLWVDPDSDPTPVTTTNTPGSPATSISSAGIRSFGKDGSDVVSYRNIIVATTALEALGAPAGLIDPSGLAATASSTHPQNTLRGPEKAIDGSGMTDAITHEANQWGDNINWMTDDFPGDDPNPWFKVELGGQHELDEMRVWNFNAEGGRTDRGVDEVDVYYSLSETDPGEDFANDWSLLGTYNLTEAPGTDDYFTPDVIDFGGQVAEWVALDVATNHGGAFVGLSEVRFYGQLVPEPATLLVWSLLAAMAIGLGWRRR